MTDSVNQAALTDMDVTAGVDIGGTNTAVGIVDSAGRELAAATMTTDARGGVDSFARRLAALINQLCKGLPVSYSLRGIGIASPAANYRDGTIESPANLSWGTINMVALMKQFFDLPIAIANDGDAAALGEMTFGAARELDNYLVVTLGTGLGAGIVTGGVLLRGETGVAGELGHVIMEPGGRECGCGRRGCAETYVSATGLRRTVYDLLARRTAPSELRSIAFDALTGKKVYALALGGDPIACEAFQVTGAYLGRLLANVVAVLDPQAVILAGGLANAGELLLVPTRTVFEEHVLSIHKEKIDLLISSLPDGQAAVLGASHLVRVRMQEDLVS